MKMHPKGSSIGNGDNDMNSIAERILGRRDGEKTPNPMSTYMNSTERTPAQMDSVEHRNAFSLINSTLINSK
jgi:hypothetical protein